MTVCVALTSRAASLRLSIASSEAVCNMFGPVSSCPHESLLCGPQTEDRRSGLDWHAQGTGRPRLRCGPLDGQTLRGQSRTRRRPYPSQASRQAAQGECDGREAPRARPAGTPDGHAFAEERAASRGGWDRGERLHRLANAEAHGLRQKKDRWERRSETSS
jgi:hypothetical protein